MLEFAGGFEECGVKGPIVSGEFAEFLGKGAGVDVDGAGGENEVDGGRDFGVGLDGLNQREGVDLEAGCCLEPGGDVVEEGILTGCLFWSGAGKLGEGLFGGFGREVIDGAKG